MTDEILKFIRQYQGENAFYGIDSGSEFVIAEAFLVAFLNLDVRSPAIKEIAKILGVKEGEK